MTPDFSRIYAELGLQPDCRLEDFRHAYRQRLSERHPDRPAMARQPAGALPLGELTALYASAIQFHREHGRLPGSASMPPLHRHVAAVPAAVPESRPPARTLAHWLLAAAMLAVSLAIGVFVEQAPGSRVPARNPEPGAASAAVPSPVPAQAQSGPLARDMLELGMDAASVRAIQGDPMRVSGEVWEYGPSWLRIERGHLVDWHSSPLRRLKTRTASPSAMPDLGMPAER